MSIEELSKKEDKLLSQMLNKGHFDENDQFLSESEYYKEWQKIFNEYSELAISGNLEAMKRAVFLLWYQTCEPAPLSGLINLDTKYISLVLEYLNSLIKNGKVDHELSWMLPYYYMVAEWYLPDSGDYSNIKEFSSINQDYWESQKDKSEFNNRGQLGDYWRSISSH